MASTTSDLRWTRSDRVFLKNVLNLLKDSLIQRRYLDQLFRQATVDALTGLSNRRFFLDHLENEMHRHQRFHFEAGMLMLDLDHFKNVNDTYGHDCGDEVLKDFAHKAKSCLREVDYFGRLGGEEFAILLPVTDKNGAMVVAERIRKTIETGEIRLNGQPFKYTVSIGVTLLHNGETKEDLLKRADQAMYEAKMSGRNRVHLMDAAGNHLV